MQKVPVGADGTFTLTNVPSPNVYELVVTKTGYATSTLQLDVAGGEARTGVELTLRKGDGSSPARSAIRAVRSAARRSPQRPARPR